MSLPQIEMTGSAEESNKAMSEYHSQQRASTGAFLSDTNACSSTEASYFDFEFCCEKLFLVLLLIRYTPLTF